MLRTILPRMLHRDRACILGSALLILTAFFIPESFGFLILAAWVPLVLLVRPIFKLGFAWGIIIFGGHFVWLMTVLATKTAAPGWAAVLVYVGMVCYFSVTSGVWFWVDGLFVRRWPDGWRRLAGWWLLAGGYYWFLSNYSLWIFCRCEGYPFLNPAIPLARYWAFLWAVAKIGLAFQWLLGYPSPDLHTPANVNFVYCPPVKKSGVGQLTPVGLGQAIYHQLTTLELPVVLDRTATTIVVAPETFYPASLNLYPEQGRLWCSGLPDNVHLIVGSQAHVGRKYYQTAYWLHQGLIKKYYVKKHQVPFVEKVPRGWRTFNMVKDIFLKNNEQFSKDRRSLADDLFVINQDVVILPQLCSEFFFTTDANKVWAGHQKAAGRNFFIVFLVNDSWFMKYLKQLLQDLTAIKAAFLGVPVIYVGHDRLIKINGP